MPAPLMLLAAYAYSAKKKGDRQRSAAAAERANELAKIQSENAMGTLYQTNTGGFMVVKDGDLTAKAQAEYAGGKALKYGKIGSLSYDIPQNNTFTDIYSDFSGREGPISMFSNEQQIGLEGTSPVKVGVRGTDGEVKYDPQYMIDNRRNTGSITPTSDIKYEVTHPDLPGGSFSGSLSTVTSALRDNGIKNDDSNLRGTRFVENVDKDGNPTKTSVADYDFASPDSGGSGKISDVRYYMKDGTSVMGSEGTYVDQNEVAYTEYGSVDVDGTFRPTSTQSADQAGESKSGLAAALEASNAPYLIKYNNEYVAASNEDSIPERLSSFFTQLSGNLPMVKDFNTRYENGDPSAVINVDNLYKDLLSQYNEVKVGQSGTMLATYNMSMTFGEFMNLYYGGASQLIPALMEKAEQYDNEETNKKRIELTQQASTPSVTGTVGVVDVDTPSDVAAMPDTPRRSRAFVVNRYPSKFDTLMQQGLRPTLKTKINNPTGPDGNEIPLDEAVEIAIGQFINYKVDERGIRVKDRNNNFIPSDNQPMLEFLEDLRVNGIPGSNQTQLDFFIGTMLDPRKSFVDQLNDTGKQVALMLADSTNGNIRETTQLIAPLMASGKGADVAMGKKYGFEQDPAVKRNFLDGQLGVLAASRRGLGIVNDALSTYYGPNGELLAPTTLANFYLMLEGVEYYAGKAADFAGIDFNNESSVMAAGSAYMTNARNRLKQSGILVEDSTALAEMESELKSITNSKYAQREFFTLVLAYEVAAAIQGGTGGRTISDQDVALIFRGLRQRFTDGPQSQIAALRAVQGMLQQFEYRAQMLTQDTKTRAAYMTAENLLFAAGIDIAPRFTTASYVTAELGPSGGSGTGNQTSADPFFGLSEPDYNKRLLEKANESNLTGRPYTSLDDIPARKRQTAKRSLDAQLQNLQQRSQGGV